MADQTTTTGTEVGRALIDRFGDIWRITPEGVRAPEADDYWAREQVERHYGPLREVVLVEGAGRLAEVARQRDAAAAERDRIRGEMEHTTAEGDGRG